MRARIRNRRCRKLTVQSIWHKLRVRREHGSTVPPAGAFCEIRSRARSRMRRQRRRAQRLRLFEFNLRRLDAAVETSAADCGASPRNIIQRICAPALSAVCVCAFIVRERAIKVTRSVRKHVGPHASEPLCVYTFQFAIACATRNIIKTLSLGAFYVRIIQITNEARARGISAAFYTEVSVCVCLFWASE